MATSTNSLFTTRVDNVSDSSALEPENGALINEGGTLKMGDGSAFNEVGSGDGYYLLLSFDGNDFSVKVNGTPWAVSNITTAFVDSSYYSVNVAFTDPTIDFSLTGDNVYLLGGVRSNGGFSSNQLIFTITDNAFGSSTEVTIFFRLA